MHFHYICGLLTLNRCASVPLGISSLAQWIYNSIRNDPPTALESVEDLRQLGI